MPPLPAGKEAGPGDGVPGYQRHRPERTLLYQLVEQYYPVFADLMATQGRPLPEYVQREFEDYLKCGCLEHGFLRVRCTSCRQEQLVGWTAAGGPDHGCYKEKKAGESRWRRVWSGRVVAGSG